MVRFGDELSGNRNRSNVEVIITRRIFEFRSFVVGQSNRQRFRSSECESHGTEETRVDGGACDQGGPCQDDSPIKSIRGLLQVGAN